VRRSGNSVDIGLKRIVDLIIHEYGGDVSAFVNAVKSQIKNSPKKPEKAVAK
jgi:hypothetical protein